MAACLRAAPAQRLNAAQTKVRLNPGQDLTAVAPPHVSRLCVSQILAVNGPFQAFTPIRQSDAQSFFRGVDLLLGTSAHDGLISRARKIKVRGHARDGPAAPTVF